MQKLKKHAFPKLLTVFAVAAMAIPAMANPPEMLLMGICDPRGVTRTVAIPIEREDGEAPEDCAMACHAICSRKKAAHET